MEIKNEIAYLEYGKTYNELTEGEKREVDYEYNDLIDMYQYY